MHHLCRPAECSCGRRSGSPPAARGADEARNFAATAVSNPARAPARRPAPGRVCACRSASPKVGVARVAPAGTIGPENEFCLFVVHGALRNCWVEKGTTLSRAPFSRWARIARNWVLPRDNRDMTVPTGNVQARRRSPDRKAPRGKTASAAREKPRPPPAAPRRRPRRPAPQRKSTSGAGGSTWSGGRSSSAVVARLPPPAAQEFAVERGKQPGFRLVASRRACPLVAQMKNVCCVRSHASAWLLARLRAKR